MKCFKCGKECNTNHFMVIVQNEEGIYSNKYCCSLKCCSELYSKNAVNNTYTK